MWVRLLHRLPSSKRHGDPTREVVVNSVEVSDKTLIDFEGATMTWQEYALIFGTVVAGIELLYLIRIFIDDHRMRQIAEESLQIQKQSLEAQQEYLVMRRKWYAARVKSKEKDNDQQRAAGLSDGNSPNAV